MTTIKATLSKQLQADHPPLFKLLNPDHTTRQGYGTWEPGVWQRVTGPLEPCRNGLHLIERRDLRVWMWEGCEVWTCEVDGRYKRVRDSDKTVVRRARAVERVGVLDARKLRLFAADCAESVVHLTGPDQRCLDAIATARRYANGEATRDELRSARDAVEDVVRSVAWDVVRSAPWDAAWFAAEAAAEDAAEAAAEAAWFAAEDAARDEQTDRLWTYVTGDRA